jgi:DNA-3-methyladenine glycosylase I
MSSYCEYCNTHPEDTFNRSYHDRLYGFPLNDDNGLFERLILEINQAGLSWITILKKAENFRRAYDGFELEKVAAYGQADQARLLADAGIVRNRLKIKAAIENAQRILALRVEFGSFQNWLDAHQQFNRDDAPKISWTKLFKKTFVFTGGEIVNEFLMSTGYLPGAHTEDCPVFSVIAKLKPAWML